MLISLAWLVPNHYLPWRSAYNEACSILGLVTLGVDALLNRRNGFPMVVPPAGLFALAISLIPLGQLLSGKLIYSGDAYVSILYLACLSAAIAIGRSEAKRSDSAFIVEVAWAIFIVGLICSVLTLIQVSQLPWGGLWIEALPPAERPSANLGQPNNLATLLSWAVVWLMYLYERRRMGCVASCAALLMLICGLAATQSRTSLAFGPVALVAACTLGRQIGLRTSSVFVGISTIFHWSAFFAWPAVQRLLLPPLSKLPIERGVESMRFEMWPRMLDALRLEPWTGYGWLQIGRAQIASAPNFPPAPELWFQSHNLFLDLALWSGLPLALIVSVGLIAWWIARWRAVRELDSMAAMMALTMLGIHAMVEYPYQYAYFLIPAGLWIGAVELSRIEALPMQLFSVGGRTVQSIALASYLAALSLFATLLVVYPRVEEQFRRVRFETIGVSSPGVDSSMAHAPGMSGVGSYIDSLRLAITPNMSPEVIRRLELNVERYPYEGTMKRLALAYALNARLSEAQSTLTLLRLMHGDAAFREAIGNFRQLKETTFPQLSEQLWRSGPLPFSTSR